jgi:hypothetical protein
MIRHGSAALPGTFARGGAFPPELANPLKKNKKRVAGNNKKVYNLTLGVKKKKWC